MNERGLGVNVWWTVPGVKVDGEVLKTALARHGFGAEYVKLPTRRLEVSRAAYSLQDRRGKSNRCVTEKTQDNGVNAVYGILDQHRVDDESVKFSQGTTVRLNKDTGEVVAEGSKAAEFSTALQEFEGKATDEDIRVFLRRIIIRCHGVPKRPSGGIYFVPSDKAELMKKAQAVLEELGSAAKIYTEGVINDKEARENVWEAVEIEIDARIAEAVLAADRIQKSSNAVKSQKLKLENLTELMDVYKGLLGEEAKHEAVMERIEEAVKAVEARMHDLQPGGSSAPAKASGPSKSKVVEAAIQVLTGVNGAMEYHELTKQAIEAGLYESKSPDPAASLNACLARAITGGDNRVVRIRRGWYALASK